MTSLNDDPMFSSGDDLFPRNDSDYEELPNIPQRPPPRRAPPPMTRPPPPMQRQQPPQTKRRPVPVQEDSSDDETSDDEISDTDEEIPSRRVGFTKEHMEQPPQNLVDNIIQLISELSAILILIFISSMFFNSKFVKTFILDNIEDLKPDSLLLSGISSGLTVITVGGFLILRNYDII